MANSFFFLPPEWAPHQALWIGWPRLDADWTEGLEAARDEAAKLIEHTSRFVPVRIAIGDPAALSDALARGLDEVADLIPLPMQDVWLRDTGPLTGFENGQLAARAFRFNGWGERFPPGDDRYTAGALAAMESAFVTAQDFILEGGSIEVDGEGRLMTTEECLLNPNRHGGWTRQIAEAHLKDALNVTEVIWIKRGLLQDHTDGHIDNAARFIGPGHVLCQTASGADDPHAERLLDIKTTLSQYDVRVSTLPSPGRVLDRDGDVVPASHLNFIITNGAVILPVYDDLYGKAAAAALAQLMPDHEIVPLRADHLLKGGGGAFHCMSCHIPEILE